MVPQEVHIIGAGMSGLSLAFELQQAGFSNIKVFEKRGRPGGLISTKQSPYGPVETAANTIIKTARLAQMLQTIDLSEQAPFKHSKKRYLYVGGRFSRFPLTIIEIFAFLRGLIRLFINKKRYRPQKQQTVHQWAEKVFGAAIACKLIGPGLQGIYADQATNLSSTLILNKYFSKQKKSRSQGIISFSQGMEQLPITLAHYLQKSGVHFFYNHDYQIKAGEHTTIIATSLKEARELKEEVHEQFCHVPLKDVVTTTLFYRQTSPLYGFGALLAPQDHIRCLGVLNNHHIFSGRVNTDKAQGSETWIGEDAGSDEQNIRNALATRSHCFQGQGCVSDKPVATYTTSWPGAFPLYGTKLEEALETGKHLQLKLEQEHIYLTGNYLGNLGLSGILDDNYQLAQRLKYRYEQYEQ